MYIRFSADEVSRSQASLSIRLTKVLEQCVVVPLDTLGLVGLRVCEAINRACVTAKETVQVGTNLVALVRFSMLCIVFHLGDHRPRPPSGCGIERIVS